MAIFAIGDLHLSLGGNKPMDVFGGWENYVEKLSAAWHRLVGPQDTVVLAGDTSWAMALEECREDFAFIESLPGKKVLLKGNHDYWWTTRSKMDKFLEENGFQSLSFLHNNAVAAEGLMLCGTRGWMHEAHTPHDEKIISREAGRLETSLQAAEKQCPGAEKVVFLHYPPVYPGAVSQNMVEALQRHGVKRCYYGHLHGEMTRRAIQGTRDGISYRLISADALEFIPEEIDV